MCRRPLGVWQRAAGAELCSPEWDPAGAAGSRYIRAGVLRPQTPGACEGLHNIYKSFIICSDTTCQCGLLWAVRFKDYTWLMMNDCVFLGLHETSSHETVLKDVFWLSPLTSRLSPWQETVTEAGCLLTLQMRSSKEPQCWKPCGYWNTTKCLFIKTACIQIFLSCKTLITLEKKKRGLENMIGKCCD